MIRSDKNVCLRCSGCVGVCPRSALTLKEHGIVCDPEKCVSCGICVNFCPVSALKLEDE
jgi:NAD-dependent dihydropyrimidine dehydrogenase PreA subunit